MKFSEMPYVRVEQDYIENTWKDLIERAKEAPTGEALFGIHKEMYKFADYFMTNATLAEIRNSIDTSDEFYDKEKDYFNDVMPIYQFYETEYSKVLYESKHRAYMTEKIGKVAFKNIELAMKSMDEKLIPLMQKENALQKNYERIISSAQISFEGKIYNLPMMTKFMTSDDRDVRKRAWKAVSDYFLTVTDQLDEIYDQMVKNRDQQGKIMGYENFLPLGYNRMRRNCYDKDMVENFRRQVKDHFVPFVTEIHERRRKRIGVEKLTYFDKDVYFQNGNPAPVGNADEILAEGLKMYKELSRETGEFMEFMCENELFDVLSKPNKMQGGYMTYLPDFKAPFIFANFNGTDGDIAVITHECGHAFQGFTTRNEVIREYLDITSETAEIHSMSMEFFTYPWMENFFGDRAEDYLKMHFESAAVFVPYGCMVDEFQHRVYENPEMTPAERKALWKKLESEYRPELDYMDDPFFSQGGFWQKQLHIFVCPLYYIDYVLAQLCAFQYKAWMDENRDAAWRSYYLLCRLSARGYFTDMVKTVGLNSPFEDGCVKSLVEKLRKECGFDD
ncbi:MAG: M3 family oligoendopeptidase [Dorea sp.]|nr:M3 family oligoendopeptidase [Dorea sp.]